MLPSTGMLLLLVATVSEGVAVFFRPPSTYRQAFLGCSGHNWRLLIINNATEMSNLKDLSHENIRPGRRYWIGVVKTSASGIFSTSNGTTMTYSNWETGYPVNDATARCVSVDARKGFWRNVDCGRLFAFVCDNATTVSGWAVSSARNNMNNLRNASNFTTMPYVKYLLRSPMLGEEVVVTVRLPPNPASFAVNMLEKYTGNDNVDDHLVRLKADMLSDGSATVYLQQGTRSQWTTQNLRILPNVSASSSGFQLVTFRVRIQPQQFSVDANGVQMQATRNAAREITVVHINGALAVLDVHVEGLQNFIQKATIPFPFGYLPIGARVSIYGNRSTTNQAFYGMEFTNERRDILFHISMRLGANWVVFNSRLSNETYIYSMEEQVVGHPILVSLRPFHDNSLGMSLDFENTPTQMNVYLNGEFFYGFRHRTLHPESEYRYIVLFENFDTRAIEYTSNDN